MSYSRTDYYAEGLAEAFEEHGVLATKEQIQAIAEDVVGWSESIGMAFHQPEHPSVIEAETLKKALERERSKVVCRHCNGFGIISVQGPHHGSTSSCFKCNGEGRHAP